MKNILLTSVILMSLIFSSCIRQNIRPLPQPVREYSFIEDFNNDNRGWSFADPVNLAYGVVSNGTFKFDYNDNYAESYYVSRGFGFNPYNDFTLTTKIGSNNNMGLLFGYDERNYSYGYTFTIDYDGYFALYDEGGNGYGPDVETLVEPQTNNRININGNWNILTLEQRGNRWIGYINDYQVFNVASQNFKGSGIGFMNVANTQGEADYIEAHWLD